MALDLNNLLASLTGNADARIATINAQANAMAQDTAAISDLLSTNVVEGQAVVQNSAALAAEKAAIDYQVQSAKEKAAAIVGLNEDDQENELVRSMRDYNAAEEQRKVARAEYDQLASADLLTNPVGYILAQLQLPAAAARNNAAADARDAAAANISTRQQLLTQHKSAMVVNTAQATKDLQMRQAENDAAVAQIKLREAEAQNLSAIAGRRLQEFQHRNSIFAVQDAALARQLQVAQFQMSLEERQEARKERERLAQERQKVKDQEEEELAEFNTQLQRVSQFLGMRAPMNVELWKKLPQAKREAWRVAAQSGTIGTTLQDSLMFLNSESTQQELTTQNPGVATAARRFTDSVSSYAATIYRDKSKQGQTVKPKELAEESHNAYATDLVVGAGTFGSRRELTSRHWDSVFTPYRAEYKVMADEIAGGRLGNLQNNVVVKALTPVLEKSEHTRGNISTEEERQMLKTLAMMVKARDVGLDEAAQQVSQFYTTAALKNRDLYQYDNFNLPPQTRYIAKIPSISITGEDVEVDMMNTASVKRALAKLAASGKGEQWLGGFSVVN